MIDKERDDMPVDRNSLEGQYTQQGATRPRTVHGQYTESGADAPDAVIEGEYTGASHHGEEPQVSSTQMRHGNYPKAEH